MARYFASGASSGGLVFNVRDYGAVGDGVADDTAAIHSALADAVEVTMPPGTYKTTGISVPAGKSLRGTWSRSYTGTPTLGTRIVAATSGQTTPVVTLGINARLESVAVIGAGTAHDAIRLGGINTVRDCVGAGAGTGINGNYTGVNVIDNCQLHDNVTGAKDTIDSAFLGCYFNVNTADGVTLGSGANDNSFWGCKFEFNTAHGIQVFQAHHNTIVGGVADRNGKTGIRMVSCQNSSVSSMVLRRNGRFSSGTAADDCHFYQEACTNLTVMGVTTVTGADDDASGYTSPAVSVRNTAGTDVLYVANSFAGATTATKVVEVTAGTRVQFIGNASYNGVQAFSGSRTTVGETTAQALTTATASLVFTGDTIATYTTGKVYRLAIVARDTSTGTRSQVEMAVLVSREAASALITLGELWNQVGTAFGTTTGTYRVTAAVSTDGATITISVQNTSANTVQFLGRLT